MHLRIPIDPVRHGRTIALAAMLVALAAPSLFASSAAGRTSETTTVTLVARDAHAGALNAAIGRFEELHPDIDVKATYPATNAAVATAITTGVTTKPGVDIVVLSTSGGPLGGLPSLWDLGPRYLTDLTARPWAKNLWKPLLPLASVAGKVYGLPMNTGSMQFVVYNQDLFAQLGLTPPTTWSGLLAYCNKVADTGRVPLKVAGATPIHVGTIALAIAANTVYTTEPFWSAKRNAGKVTFAGTPGWRQALQQILDLKGARCFDPSPATVTSAVALRAFNGGETPAIAMGGWDVINGIQEANPSLEIGFFPIPGQSVKTTRVMVNPGEYLAVNDDSPVKAEALEFLDFVAGAWQGVAIANFENSVSSLDAAKGVAPKALPHFAPFVKAHQLVVSPLIFANNANAVAVFRGGITSLLAGTKTIDQVLAELDAAW
jgi:raffinose/stachyose/melibiose transport system substrate-binding protein